MTDQNFNNEEPFVEAASGETEPSGGNITPQMNYVTYIPYGLNPKTFEEKRGIKKLALTSGLALLFLIVFTSLWATALFFIAGAFGFDVEKLRSRITEPAVMQVVQVFFSVFVFTVPFIVIYKINGYRISDLIPLNKPEKGGRVAIFFLGLSFCAFANIASSYASNIFSGFGIDYEVDYGENPTGVFGFILSVIATAVVPALVEEFACRGLIMGSLRKYGDGFAVLVSAIVFGLMHGNFDQIPFATMVGLVLGFIVIKTGSLWIAVLVHAANNLISVLFDYFLSSAVTDIQNLMYVIYLMAVLLSGIISVCFYAKGKSFEFKPSTTESTLTQKCSWFFLSPAIIIFAVLCIVESFAYFIN